jgi:molybdate/tungstate transport system substrate-binding protein
MRAGYRTALLLVAAVALFGSAVSQADTGPVFVANAGVLGNMVNGLKTPFPALTNQTGGSVALAQSIESGTLAPDIFGSADASVNKFLLGDANNNKERWFAAFARNAIVMQYSPSPADPHAADFAKVAAGQEPWYQPLITGPPINLCRMSPDADPSGYYTLFVLQLAEEFYGIPGLKQQVLGDDRNPAQTSSTCSQGKSLANGTLDVSFSYLSGALAGATPFVMLPDRINLSNPDDVDVYSTASFTNSAGQTFHGGVIRPSFAPIEGSANASGAHAVLQYIFQNQASLVSTFHFLPSDLYAGGDPTAIPADLRPYFNLRELDVTLVLNPFPTYNYLGDGCSADKLRVSGDGVTVASVELVHSGRLQDLLRGPQCKITLDVAAGETGMRDLILTNPAFPPLPFRPKTTDKTFADAVDLSQAIPVVPPFLQ